MATGAIIGAIVAGAAAAGTSAYQAHQQKKLAKQQQKQQEALAEKEADLRTAGARATTTEADVAATNRQRSALRRTILTNQQPASTKLGD